MTYRESIYIEAPVEKVFDFIRDPGNWKKMEPEGVVFKDVRLTAEGVGTHYTWVATIAGVSFEGFGVFTEFIPNERIVDKSSLSLEGNWTYLVEPAGSGTRLTIENRVGSFWRLPPLARGLDRLAAKTHGPRLVRIKELLESAAN